MQILNNLNYTEKQKRFYYIILHANIMFNNYLVCLYMPTFIYLIFVFGIFLFNKVENRYVLNIPSAN